MIYMSAPHPVQFDYACGAAISASRIGSKEAMKDFALFLTALCKIDQLTVNTLGPTSAFVRLHYHEHCMIDVKSPDQNNWLLIIASTRDLSETEALKFRDIAWGSKYKYAIIVCPWSIIVYVDLELSLDGMVWFYILQEM